MSPGTPGPVFDWMITKPCNRSKLQKEFESQASRGPRPTRASLWAQREGLFQDLAENRGRRPSCAAGNLLGDELQQISGLAEQSLLTGDLETIPYPIGH
jgi:hypothetical protein